jgi:DNA-binding CsgD family transcriptional regulator
VNKTSDSKVKKNQTKLEHCYFDRHNKQYLTRRESQCFSYLLRAYSAKATARKLGIATDTVEKYVDMLKKRFGCSKKMELIVKANRDGMTDTVLAWVKEEE